MSDKVPYLTLYIENDESHVFGSRNCTEFWIGLQQNWICHKVWSKKILPKHMSGVKSANLSTVCLDESLNDISNRKEMDSHLLYDICAENWVVRVEVATCVWENQFAEY